MDLLAVGISLVSLAVSIWVAWSQHLSGGRAHFTAEWENSSSLIFTNQGPGAATTIVADLANGNRSVTVTAEYMGARQHMRIHIFRAFGQAPPGPLTISWHDNRRKGQTAELDLPDAPHQPPSVQGASALEKAVRAVAMEEAQKEIVRRHL